MKHTTTHQIQLASQERTLKLQEQEITTLTSTLNEKKQELETHRQLLGNCESANIKLTVKVDHLHDSIASIQTTHEEEVNKRIELQNKYTKECALKQNLELLHEKTKQEYYEQWLERETYIDQIELEKIMEDLLVQVDKKVTIEEYEAMKNNAMEEKNIMSTKLKELLDRVSILPKGYQENIIFNERLSKEELHSVDVYELMEKSNEQKNQDKLIKNGCNDDDEPSLADGCQSQ